MNIIFLDIDGVLNEQDWMLNGTPWIDEEKLSLVSRLCKETNADVILSSNWREVWNEPMFLKNKKNGIYKAHKLFKKYHINVLGTTPVLNTKLREEEILATLYTLEGIIDNYVIFDDKKLLLKNFIQTDGKIGLTQSDYEKALSILNT